MLQPGWVVTHFMKVKNHSNPLLLFNVGRRKLQKLLFPFLVAFKAKTSLLLFPFCFTSAHHRWREVQEMISSSSSSAELWKWHTHLDQVCSKTSKTHRTGGPEEQDWRNSVLNCFQWLIPRWFCVTNHHQVIRLGSLKKNWEACLKVQAQPDWNDLPDSPRSVTSFYDFYCLKCTRSCYWSDLY